MKKMIQDIHKGKNLKENLRRYSEMAVRTYADYATLDLAFSAYMFVEEMLEEEVPEEEMPGGGLTGGERTYAQEKSGVWQEILVALSMLAKEPCPYGELAQKMDALRREIIKKMDLLTAYTDRLICYEYVLNRMELRFMPERELNQLLAGFPEEGYMDKLRGYLFGDRDRQVMYDKLRLVIGEIPVQMTKSKLFEKIGAAMTLYKGDDRSAIDRFLYMMRTAAMIYEPECYVGHYKELENILTQLEEADYTKLTKKQYDGLKVLLETGIQEIRELTDFYYSVQKVVNGIYALCVVLPHAQKESQLQKDGREVFGNLADRICDEELLSPMEGSIETLVEKTGYLESVLFEIQDSYSDELDKEGLVPLLGDLVIVSELLSDSLFIELDKGAEEKIDASYVQSAANQLFDELTEKFSHVSRPLKRAIMGQILGKLPIMFQSVEEIEQYIRVNLMGCTDKAEKGIVLTMLWDFMIEEEREGS